MKVESIAECSPWSILQYFWPALSDNWSLKPIFGHFESGSLTQVSLYLWTVSCSIYCMPLNWNMFKRWRMRSGFHKKRGNPLKKGKPLYPYSKCIWFEHIGLNLELLAVIHLQFELMGPGTRCFQYQWVPTANLWVQNTIFNDKSAILLHPGTQYYCIPGLTGTRWNKNLCAKDAGCAGNKITVLVPQFLAKIREESL